MPKRSKSRLVNAARSTLEVKTRRLPVASGFTDFVREFPLAWNGRSFRYDFCFPRSRTILETNGRRWHDDPADYEDATRSGASRGVTTIESCSRPGRRSLDIPTSSSES